MTASINSQQYRVVIKCFVDEGQQIVMINFCRCNQRNIRQRFCQTMFFIVFKNCATYLVVSVRPNSVSFSSREEIIKFVFNRQADFFV